MHKHIHHRDLTQTDKQGLPKLLKKKFPSCCKNTEISLFHFHPYVYVLREARFSWVRILQREILQKGKKKKGTGHKPALNFSVQG